MSNNKDIPFVFNLNTDNIDNKTKDSVAGAWEEFLNHVKELKKNTIDDNGNEDMYMDKWEDN